MNAPSADSSKSPLHVIVIGASAGSIEPLRRMLKQVSYDHASYIVSTHLPPTFDSQLASVLQRYSVLPLRKVVAPVQLQTNHVYVGGEGVELCIKDDMLHTVTANRVGPRRSIDRLMRTLAEQWGTRGFGVILSGTGFDGTAGLAAVRKAGGVTMAQAPDSARWDSMPRSAMPFADYVMPPEALGIELMRILDSRPVPEPEPQEEAKL